MFQNFGFETAALAMAGQISKKGINEYGSQFPAGLSSGMSALLLL
jgi:hypothetical protein